ncbi:MAG TPA: carboxypeptidase regulatory-like domain-containing protein [Thermoanaerobaculia bacterium]|nr:carboxypeptidase regulatory-like domain-containing protein [Thermoanaerobaculia bacterium]
MPRKVLIAVGLVLFLLLSIEGPALAQGSLTGSLQGSVKDDQGGPLPGVAVTATSSALVKGKTTTVTDSRGGYRFPSLPPGGYVVAAELQGFRKVQQPEIRVGLGQALVVDIKMALESVKTEVIVMAEAPLVSVVSNSVSNNFGSEYLEKAPLPRNYYSIIKSAPGVNTDVTGNGSAMLAYGGTQSRQNAYTIDGVNVADSGSGGYWMLPSIQWMEEIQVSGLGAAAEFGAYTGGIINGVTKSGGNEFHGGLEAYFQPESWTSNNAPEGFDTGGTFKFNNYSASLGGPIAKDKLWFFASAEYWQQITTPTGAVDTTDRTIPRFLGKVTWQASDQTRVSLMGEYDKVTQDRRGISAYTLPDASYEQSGPNATFALNGEHLFGSSSFLTLNLTGYDGRDDALPYHGFTTPGRVDEDSGYAWTNLDIYNLTHRHNVTAAASWSLFKQGLFGESDSHSFKFGASYEKGTATDEWLRNGGFTYYDYSGDCDGGLTEYFENPSCGPYYIERGYGEYDLKGQQQGLVFYAQDSVRLSRVTINAGIRYTNYKAGFREGWGNTDVYNVDNWDPRIGFVWDVTGNGRTAVKAHWGRYHSGMFTYLYDREKSGNVAVPDQDCYWDGEGFNDCDTPTSISATMGEVTHPYVDEAVFTLEHQLGKDVSIGADYVNRGFRSMMAMVNVNNDYAAVNGISNPITGAALPVYRLNSPTNFVLTTDNGSYRDFDSVTVRFDKRYSHGWQLRSSVVWTDLKGNIASNSGYANEYRDKNGEYNRDGKIALSFSEWEFKLSGAVDLPLGLVASGQYTFLSGQYWTPYGRIRSGLNYNSSTGRDINLLPRGSYQFDDRHLIDLRLAWGLKLAQAMKLELSLELFNALNKGTVLDNYNRWGQYRSGKWTPDSTYGDPYTIEAPRQVRAGVRFLF